MEKSSRETRPDQDSRKRPLDTYIRYSGLAFQLVAMILIGVWAGVKLDEQFPSFSPLFKLVFSLASVSFAVYYLIRKLTRNS